MTIAEAHIQLNLRIDKIDSAAYDQVVPEELDVYLNLATRKFIKNRFEPRSNRFILGFEQSVKRIEDLRHLLKETVIDTEYDSITSVEGTFVDKAAFPDDHFLPVRGSALVYYNEDGVTYTVVSDKRQIDGEEDTDYGSRTSDLKWAQQQQINAIARAPFNGTKIKNPLYIIQGDSIYVFTDNTFIADKVNLTYLREPTPCDLDSGTDIDLPSMLHDEVIDLAAKMILSDINNLTPARQQSLTDVE